ncbi:MAG: hypothetical protein AB1449_12915 [Chloroflexota bacterium]
MIRQGPPCEAVEQAYHRALSQALAVQHSLPGIIRARGAHRLDLLQRMSTNDLRGMEGGDVRQTVLTTALAHVVDVVWAVARADELWVIASPGRGAQVQNWLQRHIFFQDDVALSQVTEMMAHWGVYGPAAGQLLARFADLTDDIGPGRAVEFAGGLAWREPVLDGVRLLLSAEAAEVVRQAWQVPDPESASAAYQILRIEAGEPEVGCEIEADSIPLEVGLRRAVSFSKGCYLGQEIIARLDSRGRQAWQLKGLVLEGEVGAGAEVRAGGWSRRSGDQLRPLPPLGTDCPSQATPGSAGGRFTAGGRG